MDTQQHQHLVTLILHLLAGGLLGLVTAALAGHFGWRAADRMPGESRRPHCVYCLRPFEWHEIFPFFGWALRRRTLSLPCPCGVRTGMWPQPAIEMTGLVLGMAAMFLSGWGWATLPLIVGLGLLPAIALIDMHFGIIPDGLNLMVAVTGLGWAWLGIGDIYAGLIAAVGLLALGLFLALVYSRLRGREMLGLGDVKFFAAAGLWLPFEIAPWFLAIAGGLGIAFGFLWRHAGGGKELPFAPALCAALAACVFYQLVLMP
ncbi:MAG: A24 family peptidase [Bdellovibrionales bacterium]